MDDDDTNRLSDSTTMLSDSDGSVLEDNEFFVGYARDNAYYGQGQSSPISPKMKSRQVNQEGVQEKRFVLPINLSEPYVDHMGYRHICEVNFSDLRFLHTTSLNKPVMIENRVIPAVVIRLWSRCSGKYIRILDGTSEVYGRSVFGPSGGHGGKESEFIVRQADSGYCTFESVAYVGHFLGVRSNGNIMKPNRVKEHQMESQIVVQKEAMDVCKLKSKFDS
ncbi:uncharacterized protein LOC144362676 [Saccoglossus kowalevskii]